MIEKHSRQINFESISNFRDIGGYRTHKGKTVAWRRIFRSGNLNRVTEDDFKRLKEEIGLTTVIDLRSIEEIERQGTGLPADSDIKYYNVSFITDDDRQEAERKRYDSFTNMGQFYVDFTRDKGFGGSIVQALEIIAEPRNHPLAFNCAVGKDRTGILAAMLLSTLGVAEKDIIEDYTLSDQYMDALREQLKKADDIPDDVKILPDFFWRAAPESMTLLLAKLREEYGSISGYLKLMGAEDSLTERLEKALLV